uniref:Uncharacterized protein n=1 Tax=Arundo donax TaxID=35708 RepID=A0A0A8Z8W4_ARUDO
MEMSEQKYGISFMVGNIWKMCQWSCSPPIISYFELRESGASIFETKLSWFMCA